MGTVGRIHAGIAADLIERCADAPEGASPGDCTPGDALQLIHLRNLTGLAEAGATIVAPIPAWYTRLEYWRRWWTLVVRLFDGLEDDLAPLNRWSGPLE